MPYGNQNGQPTQLRYRPAVRYPEVYLALPHYQRVHMIMEPSYTLLQNIGEETIVISTRCYLSRNVATVTHTLLHINCGSTQSSSFIFFIFFGYGQCPLSTIMYSFFLFCNLSGNHLPLNKKKNPSPVGIVVLTVKHVWRDEPLQALGWSPEIRSNWMCTCIAAAAIMSCRCLKKKCRQ